MVEIYMCSKPESADSNYSIIILIITLSFTDARHNPFELTQKSQKQTLDYENNLCYCYDCDQKFKDVSIAHYQGTK